MQVFLFFSLFCFVLVAMTVNRLVFQEKETGFQRLYNYFQLLTLQYCISVIFEVSKNFV